MLGDGKVLLDAGSEQRNSTDEKRRLFIKSEEKILSICFLFYISWRRFSCKLTAELANI